MLSVIAVISAVVVPTIMTYMAQSRRVKAQQDVRAIGLAVQRFWHDTGIVPGRVDAHTGVVYGTSFELLVTEGQIPATPADAPQCAAWVTSAHGVFGDHLINNVPGYPLKTDAYDIGWHGPYLSPAPEADPWGNRYSINTVFLAPDEPLIRDDGTVKSAVFVVSAGSNGILETAFEQGATMVATSGDDIVHRLQ